MAILPQRAHLPETRAIQMPSATEASQNLHRHCMHKLCVLNLATLRVQPVKINRCVSAVAAMEPLRLPENERAERPHSHFVRVTLLCFSSPFAFVLVCFTVGAGRACRPPFARFGRANRGGRNAKKNNAAWRLGRTSPNSISSLFGARPIEIVVGFSHYFRWAYASFAQNNVLYTQSTVY